ncbi:MAG: hypothetical protein AAF443_06775 [Chlamydiota bacterium]
MASKKISQNPNDAYSKLGSLSLILSLFRPLKVFLFLICASLLAIWFVGKPYWKIQEQNWKLTHPGQDLPKPKHFGFVFGETTFEEAVQILEESGATFRQFHQADQTPEIVIDHYTTIEKLLPLRERSDEGAVLEFDDENKVYLLRIRFNRDIDSREVMQKMAAINTAYHQKHGSHTSFNPKSHKYYHIPGGVGIYIDPSDRSIEIINNRKKEIVQAYREKLSLGTWKDDMEAIISSY